MAITIDWATSVINVPQADLASLGGGIYELDIDVFRLALKSIEDSEEGMPFPKTHNHVAPITVGGVQLARVIEILSPYTVTFETLQYAVNLVGANSNIGDVTNVNQVSVRSANSAGLVQAGSGLTSAQATHLIEVWRVMGLDTARPLSVSATQRAAGAEIDQDISEAAGTVTVTRQ